MAGRIAWFDFTSKKEREKQGKAYQSRVFPFGEEQRIRELRLLRSLFPKQHAEDMLYHVVVLKEILLDELERTKDAVSGGTVEFLSENTAETDSGSMADSAAADMAGSVMSPEMSDALADWRSGPLAERLPQETQQLLLRFSHKCISLSGPDDYPESGDRDEILCWLNKIII